MLLGGLWHGAGWTFVLWGALHGVYLVVNHLWREAKPRLGLLGGPTTGCGLLAAGSVTFLAVVVAWVPFRAATLAQAGDVLAGMAGLNGVAMPLPLDEGSVGLAWAWILALLAVAWLAPNTQEIMARHLPQMRGARERRRLAELAPRATLRRAGGTSPPSSPWATSATSPSSYTSSSERPLEAARTPDHGPVEAGWARLLPSDPRTLFEKLGPALMGQVPRSGLVQSGLPAKFL